MTFLDLQTQVGLLVDDTNFGYHTLTSVKAYLNNALYEVQRRILKMNQSLYSLDVYTPLVSGQKEYVLPSDFLCMFDLWLIIDGVSPNEVTFPLEYAPPSKRHDFLTQNATPTHFWLKKNYIELMTPPDRILTMHLLYAPLVVAMSADSDIPDVPSQFHELIALYATRTCYLRDDKVNSLVTERIAQFEALIASNEQRIQNRSRYMIFMD